ncbi:hypothetical protein ACFX13_016088 [Malus domestica]
MKLFKFRHRWDWDCLQSALPAEAMATREGAQLLVDLKSSAAAVIESDSLMCMSALKLKETNLRGWPGT